MKTLREKIIDTITCPRERRWRTAGDLADRIISALMDEAKTKCRGIENCPLLTLKEIHNGK